MTTPDDIGAMLAEMQEVLTWHASAGSSEYRDVIEQWEAELSDLLAKRAEPEVGELDRSAPKAIWLQIDTSGDADDRSEPIPQDSWSELTWHHEPIGGQEVHYIRADLAPSAQPAARGRRIMSLREIMDDEDQGPPITPEQDAKLRELGELADRLEADASSAAMGFLHVQQNAAKAIRKILQASHR